MIAWLWNIVVGQLCHHKWEEIDRCNLLVSRDAIPHGQKYILQCERCGNIKTVRTV